MSKPKVILHKRFPAAALARLRAHCELIAFDDLTPANQAAFEAALPEAEALIGSGLKLDPSLLAKAPKLKAVSVNSAGVDTYNVAALNERGVILTHTPGALTETVADAALALLLAAARRVVELDAKIRRGEWGQAAVGESWFGVDLHGKTLGVLGMGRIGGAIARRAALGFGMQVLYTKRKPDPQVEQAYGARRAPLADVLGEADFVVSLLPLTETTHGLIGAGELALLKPSAIIANLGRGPVFDEAALIDALQTGRLLGAALDVFEREPLATDSPLLALPNVVLSPHVGSATLRTREQMAADAVENLLRALDLSAGPKLNVYNSEVLAA